MKSRIVASISLLCFLLVMPVAGGSAEQKAQGMQNSREASELLRKLGKQVSDFTTLKTEFIQEKELALFQDKLVLKGRIYLQKPNRIAWHVDSPVRYSVLITDKLIRQWDGDTNKVQEISLARNPVFQSVLGQLTVWFSGEYATLLQDYAIRILGDKPVVLECSPLEKSMTRKVIRNIVLTFREDQTYLRQIRIVEQSGDTTTINFVNTVLNPRLDPADFEVGRAREQSLRTSTGPDFLRLSQKSAGGRIR